MSDSRKRILEMVMAGRITPLEGERLLMAWNEERESRWIFGACAAPAALNFAHAVWLHLVTSGGVHGTAGLLSWILGGVR
jgi:hypothetical protein